MVGFSNSADPLPARLKKSRKHRTKKKSPTIGYFFKRHSARRTKNTAPKKSPIIGRFFKRRRPTASPPKKSRKHATFLFTIQHKKPAPAALTSSGRRRKATLKTRPVQNRPRRPRPKSKVTPLTAPLKEKIKMIMIIN